MLPSLNALNRPRPTARLFRYASAMMLRAELCVHKNRTLNTRSSPVMSLPASSRRAVSWYVQPKEAVRDQPQQAFASAVLRVSCAAAGIQQAPVAVSVLARVSSPNVSMASRVRYVSHATPCGSVTQYLSDFT